MNDSGSYRFLVLLSAAGGGDRQPVIAAAAALANAGHEVVLLCDESTHAMTSSDDLAWIRNDVQQTGYIRPWAERRLKGERVGNPLVSWAERAGPSVADQARAVRADVIVSSLFCMGLARLLAEDLDLPWCFINPSFYFGSGSRTRWDEDWYGAFVPILAEECFAPLAERADMVLHATDPLFDPPPDRLPANHHYTGFLTWEPSLPHPDFLDRDDGPWALITASTSRPPDEETMLRAAVDSLADKPVRIALTLPRTDWAGPTPPNAVVVGFTPHTPILERSILCISQAGHGIVSKCLIHGVPMVLMPWDADQPGVAARAGALGVAAVIGRDRATPEAVSVAVDDILNTPSHLMTARSIAATIASRSPIETAVSHLEALASVSA